MASQRGGGLWAALVWITFPAVPVVLETAYNGIGILQFPIADAMPPDPHDWGGLTWLFELGPLLGFGFLAGATLTLPDAPTDRRGPRAWLGRRLVWVAVGPWLGFLIGVPTLWACFRVYPMLPRPVGDWFYPFKDNANPTRWELVRMWVTIGLLVGTFGYAWLFPAYAAIRRARRTGEAWKAARRGLAVALAFVGSLFASFWAVTAWWRDFFFDPRFVPAVLAALSLGLLSGCTSTLTYGEVRRRELFHALLLAWTFGLALFWLWMSRSRPRPPS